MKRMFALTLLISSLSLAYAQQPIAAYDATQTAKELGVKCQKLKVAKNDCVIAHFKRNEDESSADWVSKPADLYRVLNGKTADNRYVATDYYNNGQQQSSTFTTADAQAVKTGWLESDAKITALNNTHWTREGQKTSQYDVIEGLSQGSHTMWYTNGQKQAEGQTKDNKAFGLWTEWYENGQKKSEQNYTADLLDGASITWHENGAKKKEGHYVSDHRHGLWLTYDEEGNKIEQSTFDHGQLHGDNISWYANGQKQTQAFYKNDEADGQVTTWHTNGKKSQTIYYSNGARDGAWKAWDEDGKLIKESKFKNDELISDPEQDSTQAVLAVTAEVVEATEATPASSTTTKDADAAAAELGTECRTFKRPDQCVIAYFDKNDEVQNRSKNAKYYRVLYGQVNSLFVLQDFHISGKKQSNVFFAGSYGGTLNSFYNEHLSVQGNVKGFDTQGRMYYSSDYENGQEIDSPAADNASCVDCDAAAQVAVDAASAAVDATKAAASAVSTEVQ